MTRDLTFLWEETSHETLDENKQKVREAGRRAILEWARGQGEGSDYTDNVPIQRFNPPGHFYEVPNLLRNGVLARLLDDYPAAQLAAGPQHRHPGRQPRPGHPGLGDRVGRDARASR